MASFRLFCYFHCYLLIVKYTGGKAYELSPAEQWSGFKFTSAGAIGILVVLDQVYIHFRTWDSTTLWVV